MGRSFNEVFELRQRGDYREYFELIRDQVEPLLDKGAQFVVSVRTYLDENVGLKEEHPKD
jgi:uncharacterized protein (UPF0332 family)